MWKFLILIFGFVFLFKFVLKFTPLKKWYYLNKGYAIGKLTRLKIFFGLKTMKRIRTVLQLLLDFVMFWFVFEWKKGLVKKRLKKYVATIATISKKYVFIAIDALIYLSPFGRTIVEDDKFCYALNVCTACTLFLFIFCVIGVFCDDFRYKIIKIVFLIIIHFSMWYVGFFSCYIIVQIPVYYKVLALLASIIINIIIALPVLYVTVEFLDYLDKR